MDKQIDLLKDIEKNSRATTTGVIVIIFILVFLTLLRIGCYFDVEFYRGQTKENKNEATN